MGVRELRQDAASAVRRAGQGERIIVTVNGRPVAQLGPISPSSDSPSLADLASQGLVVLPRRADRPDSPLNIELWAGVRLDRLVGEVRGR